MGLTNESESNNYEGENPVFLQSFSKPYSPSFYINNKIYDKNKTIQSIIEESLEENYNYLGKRLNDCPKEEKKIDEDLETDEDDIVLMCKSSSLEKDIRLFYKFKDFLGEGHFASVRTAYKRREYSSRKLFAVKSISLKKLTEKEYKDLIHEVDIISRLEHPHIIKFYETYHDKDYFHIVTELCRGNNLNMRLKKAGGRMKEDHVRIIMMKILHALNYCHSSGVVHRDLKPDNIVFESPDNEEEDGEEEENNNNFNIKIIDFGLSALKKKSEKLHTILGTPYYMAPEVLKGDYNEKCDIWSIGAIAYNLLSGTEPFKGDTSNKIFAKILYTEPDYNSDKFRNTSQLAIDFIKKCFVKDPDNRINCQEGLSHPWFEPIYKKIYAPKFLDDNLLYNIANTKKYTLLKRLILRFMIYNMGHTELSVYKKAFLSFDKKNSGVITPEELKSLFSIYHKPLNDEQIKRIMSVSDNHDTFLTYNEFIFCCLRIRDFLSPIKLFNAFLFFDIDNNNIIDSNDIYLTLLRWGKDVTDKDDIEKIIYFGTKKKYKELDLNSFIDIFSDDIINKQEFITQINTMKEEMNKNNQDNYNVNA
jgi:calcium-dependent protein kinase